MQEPTTRILHHGILSSEHWKINKHSKSIPVLSLFPSFSLPGVLCEPTDLILRKGTPFETMTGCTAPSSDSLLAGVFFSYKANAKRSVHNPQDHFIITLIISDPRDWRDIRGKWRLAKNPERSWWHKLKVFKMKTSLGALSKNFVGIELD